MFSPTERKFNGPDPWPMLLGLLALMGGVLTLQKIAAIWLGSSFWEDHFSLSFLHSGIYWLWTPLTYSFLHGNFLHFFFNALLFFLVGKGLVGYLSGRQLLFLYGGSALVGGLSWALVNAGSPSVLLGSSAAAMGFLACFCCLRPDKKVALWLFFIFPIWVQPRWILWGCVLLEALGLCFSELSPRAVGSISVSHSAHLGGLLWGILCGKVFFAAPRSAGRGVSIEPPYWAGVKKPAQMPYRLMPEAQEDESARNRLLDKISRKGFGALTPEDRALLSQIQRRF